MVCRARGACRSPPRIGCATPVCACTCSGRRARWRGASTRCCAPLGLTNGQFSLLTSLNRPEPPNIGSVAALLAMDRTTLTANLKPLERRRLVKVAVDKEDKRGRRLIITAAGRALLAKASVWKGACRNRTADHRHAAPTPAQRACGRWPERRPAVIDASRAHAATAFRRSPR